MKDDRIHIITGDGEEFYMPTGITSITKDHLTFPTDFAIWDMMIDIDFSDIEYLSLRFNDSVHALDLEYDDIPDEKTGSDIMRINKLVIDERILSLTSMDPLVIVHELDIPDDSGLESIDLTYNNRESLHIKNTPLSLYIMECDYNATIDNFDELVSNGTNINLENPDPDEEEEGSNIEDSIPTMELGFPSKGVYFDRLYKYIDPNDR